MTVIAFALLIAVLSVELWSTRRKLDRARRELREAENDLEYIISGEHPH